MILRRKMVFLSVERVLNRKTGPALFCPQFCFQLVQDLCFAGMVGWYIHPSPLVGSLDGHKFFYFAADGDECACRRFFYVQVDLNAPVPCPFLSLGRLPPGGHEALFAVCCKWREFQVIEQEPHGGVPDLIVRLAIIPVCEGVSGGFFYFCPRLMRNNRRQQHSRQDEYGKAFGITIHRALYE